MEDVPESLKTRWRLIRTGMLSATLAFGCGNAAAEDIEIYLGQSLGSQSQGSGTASGGNAGGLPDSSNIKSVALDRYLNEVDAAQAGINRHTIVYEYFEDNANWSYLPAFENFSARATGTLASFTDYPRQREDQYAFKFSAVVDIPFNGDYTFYTSSDDGSKIYIDGAEVVDNDGSHGIQERSGTVTNMSAGYHNVVVTFFDAWGGDDLLVQWAGPGVSKRPLETGLVPLPNYNAVHYEYYEGEWDALPDFDALTPVANGQLSTITLAPRNVGERYGFRYNSKINVPENDSYTFYLASDDGSKLSIDGVETIDNDGLHGRVEVSTTVTLAAGEHDLLLTYFEKTGGDNVTLKWSSSTIAKQDVTTWLIGDGSNLYSAPARVNFYSQANNKYITESDNDGNSTSEIGLDSAAEDWQVYHAGTSANGNDVVMVVATDSGRVLTEYSSDDVKSADSAWSNNYRWEMIPHTDGRFEFKNLEFNRYIETWNGIVSTYSSSGYEDQKIELTKSDNELLPNVMTSLDAVEWRIETVGTSAAGNPIVNLKNKNSMHYLSVDSSNGDDNAVALESIASTTEWEMLALGENRYHIRNLTDGRYLHALAAGNGYNAVTTGASQGSWIHCADEWQYCSFSGTRDVRYGKSGTYAAIQSHNGGVNCTNAQFTDPLRGTVKACEYFDASAGGSALNDNSEWIIVPTSTSGALAAVPSTIQPNLLLVLDASGSMNVTDGGETGTRLERMKIALQTVLDNINNVNVGLMRFSHSDSGGRILYPIAPVESAREDLDAIINSIVAKNDTPTVGAMYEAARYFRGEAVEFGKTRADDTSDSGVRYSRVSHPDSYTGGILIQPEQCSDTDLNHPDCIAENITAQPVYKSPIASECQSNHIVLLTDGEPTTTAIPEAISLIPGSNCAPASAPDGQCGEELASYLATENQTTTANSTVSTHTIGFNFSNDWLKEVAASGHGGFYTADSAQDLVAAIEGILLQAESHENTFAAPAATLDQTSRLSHRDDVYFALFKPSYEPAWAGNLKRYFYDGTIKDSRIPPELAVDPETGLFVENALSYWSTAADGGDIESGGAASQLNKDTRRVTTYFPGNPTNLTHSLNAVNSANITPADLALPDSSLGLGVADSPAMADWASGIDVLDYDEDNSTTDSRQYLGDPLHSTPTLITYDWNAGTPDSVIYFGTNEGYLHAVDTTSGQEVFSFIPEALLAKLKHRYRNEVGAPKTYGLDGPITSWVEDADQDLNLADSSDHAYLYVGMRRGGRNYYSLDVSTKNDPQFKWFIEGGQGNFSELGQSWSKPVLTQIANPASGQATDVLVFGGGYDPNQDHVTNRTADSMGRALFIVNAKTGALIWRGGSDVMASEIFPQMQYSIPADPRVVDLNGDGLADQIYIGDMGGQLWRFDINNTASFVSDLVNGGVIADLADDTNTGNRRFYNSPDIAVVGDNGRQFLVVSVGSGYRAHPLDQTIVDRFYVVRQPDYRNPGAGYGMLDSGVYRPITEADLFDTTSNAIAQGDDTQRLQAQQDLDASQGWYMTMPDSGEKVLASSITVNSQVLFSSYTPAAGGDPCSMVIGSGKLYVLDILDGTPRLDLHQAPGDLANAPLDVDDRAFHLNRPGIPPPPRVLFPEHGSPTLLVGPERGPEIDFGLRSKRVSWAEVPTF